MITIYVSIGGAAAITIHWFSSWISFASKARYIIAFDFKQLHVMSFAINFTFISSEVTGSITYDKMRNKSFQSLY